MSRLFISSLALFCLSLPLSAQRGSRQEVVESKFEQGRAAFYRDDIATAKRLLAEVNQADPNHKPTIILLKNIDMAEQEIARKNATMEAKMRRMVIPTLDLSEAKVPEVLEFVKIKAAEANKGQKPNFIFQLSPESQSQTITMKLGKTSLYDALQAIANAAKLEVVYTDHAVKVTSL